MRSEAPRLLPIFRSDAQARLLACLAMSPHPLSLTELAESADVAEGNAHREIRRLMEAGLVRDDRVGRTRQLSLSSTSPYAAPLCELLIRAFGPPRVLSEFLSSIEGIDRVFIYGSWARRFQGEPGDDPADIDVLVVGAPDAGDVYEACRQASSRLHREVNATILSIPEWNAEDAFVREVRSGALIPVNVEVA